MDHPRPKYRIIKKNDWFVIQQKRFWGYVNIWEYKTLEEADIFVKHFSRLEKQRKTKKKNYYEVIKEYY